MNYSFIDKIKIVISEEDLIKLYEKIGGEDQYKDFWQFYKEFSSYNPEIKSKILENNNIFYYKLFCPINRDFD